ncbi:MAG: peptidase M50 [Phycisphaera sp.]|nr:peptidase M50 [Phycisphaera sp.]
MLPQTQGSFHLFKVFGINVYVHWSWFLVAAIMVQRSDLFQNKIYFLLLYLALFAIVLMHEFGHALACRSVGGVANRIILWPLGGVAFVQPPPRPGAVLWSIAAGPLVNLIFVPITMGLIFLAGAFDAVFSSDVSRFFEYLFYINSGLLIFNMIPVYPLDGGQVLQSILWFFIGRGRSLRVAATIGIVVAVVVGVLALLAGNVWMVVMALFVGFQAFNGLRYGRYLAAQEQQEAQQRQALDEHIRAQYGRWDNKV